MSLVLFVKGNESLKISYLSLVHEWNYDLSKSDGLVNFREKMAQAYDFALEKIGMDLQSYSIWNDYVTFLKGVEAIGSYAENQKISAVRKVCIPSILSLHVWIQRGGGVIAPLQTRKTTEK